MVTWDYINAKEGNFNSLKVNGEEVSGNGNGDGNDNGFFNAGTSVEVTEDGGEINLFDFVQNIVVTESISGDLNAVNPEGFSFSEGDFLVIQVQSGVEMKISEDLMGNIEGTSNEQNIRGATLIWNENKNGWVLLGNSVK